MGKRKHTKARPQGQQTRVTFYRRRKQPEAPQSAPSTLEPRDLNPAQQDQMICIALELFSQRAAAPELDPHKWSGNSTPERMVEFYGELWDPVGKCGHDLRDILTPEEAEERVHCALVAHLLADVDLSDFAAQL